MQRHKRSLEFGIFGRWVSSIDRRNEGFGTLTQTMASMYGATSSSPKRTMSSTSSVNGVTRTKILLLGQRRSGKTSIKEVLFNALPPKQTFYLETTMRIVKHAYECVHCLPRRALAKLFVDLGLHAQHSDTFGNMGLSWEYRGRYTRRATVAVQRPYFRHRYSRAFGSMPFSRTRV